MGDLLRLVAGSEHAGGNATTRVGGAEDLLEVRPDVPSDRRSRHGHTILPLDPPNRAAGVRVKNAGTAATAAVLPCPMRCTTL